MWGLRVYDIDTFPLKKTAGVFSACIKFMMFYNLFLFTYPNSYSNIYYGLNIFR